MEYLTQTHFDMTPLEQKQEELIEVTKRPSNRPFYDVQN
jgi:hypothetical protein